MTLHLVVCSRHWGAPPSFPFGTETFFPPAARTPAVSPELRPSQKQPSPDSDSHVEEHPLPGGSLYPSNWLLHRGKCWAFSLCLAGPLLSPMDGSHWYTPVNRPAPRTLFPESTLCDQECQRCCRKQTLRWNSATRSPNSHPIVRTPSLVIIGALMVTVSGGQEVYLVNFHRGEWECSAGRKGSASGGNVQMPEDLMGK